ncbi:MAG TPA: YkgJ family cysteine cluster protein [Terriglobia bacterium]|nr:YkgJ family cysteine cluster protein [Terriglobia bacterium]
MRFAGEADDSGLACDLRQETAEGFFYTHTRLSQNTNKSLEASSFVYALIELLSEKGLISVEELDERKKIVAERLIAQLKEKGLGVMLQDDVEDKYSFQGEAHIDCENRIEFCRAACCRLRFALSKQDVHEGVIKWDLGRPYLIAQGKDGYCTHLERGTCQCTVREHRPVPCRGYDCRNDKRIWADFENKIVNPNLQRPDWPQCEVAAKSEGTDNAA